MKTTANDLTKRFDSILGFVETSVRDAAAFAKGESSAVVKEVLRWGIVSSVLTQAISSLLFVVVLVASITFKSVFFTKDFYGNEEGLGVLVIVPYVAELILFAIFCWSFEWLQILVAPRVYLLEYVKGLLAPPSSED